VFDFRSSKNNPKAVIEGQLMRLKGALDAFKVSFEYIQDYIGIYGLKMWQEEYARIWGFNTEMVPLLQ
jgi:WASH complex subunit strumpellin